MQNQQKKAFGQHQLQHLHVSKEISTACCFGERQGVGKGAFCDISLLGCLSEGSIHGACSMGSKHEELDLCVQLQILLGSWRRETALVTGVLQ